MANFKGHATRSENKKMLDELAAAYFQLGRTHPSVYDEEYCRCRNLSREMLARLDRSYPPFKSGELIRVRRHSHETALPTPLQTGVTYHVDQIRYEGNGQWLLTIKEEERRLKTSFHARLFEKVRRQDRRAVQTTNNQTAQP